jgi:hypothetical protein
VVWLAEAPGDPADGAVAVGGERRPPQGQRLVLLFYIGEENEKTPGRQHVWSVDMYVRWFRFLADFSGVFFLCVCVCV